MPRSKNDISTSATPGTVLTNSLSQPAAPRSATDWIAAWIGNSDFDEEGTLWESFLASSSESDLTAAQRVVLASASEPEILRRIPYAPYGPGSCRTNAPSSIPDATIFVSADAPDLDFPTSSCQSPICHHSMSTSSASRTTSPRADDSEVSTLLASAVTAFSPA